MNHRLLGFEVLAVVTSMLVPKKDLAPQAKAVSSTLGPHYSDSATLVVVPDT